MRIKHKHILLILLLLAVLHQFRVPSFSLNRGWLEGTFWDKDTGEPLEGVVVTFFTKDSIRGFSESLETQTDKNGRFIINQVIYGEFIIRGRKSGYVTYQPKYKIRNLYRRKDLVEVLSIGEGELRYLDIPMERGGQLLVKVFKKDENGISPYTDFSAQIGFRTGENIEDIFT